MLGFQILDFGLKRIGAKFSSFIRKFARLIDVIFAEDAFDIFFASFLFVFTKKLECQT